MRDGSFLLYSVRWQGLSSFTSVRQQLSCWDNPRLPSPEKTASGLCFNLFIYYWQVTFCGYTHGNCSIRCKSGRSSYCNSCYGHESWYVDIGEINHNGCQCFVKVDNHTLSKFSGFHFHTSKLDRKQLIASKLCHRIMLAYDNHWEKYVLIYIG